MRELADLAARAEALHLGQVARRRILAQTGRDRAPARRPLLAATPAWILAAAGILVLVVVPAALVMGPVTGPGDTATPGDPLDLMARLGDGGAVILEWRNGDSIHTVRVATSRTDLTRVAATRVRGGQFQDAAAGNADIVYYQVD